MVGVISRNYGVTFKRLFRNPMVFQQFVDDLCGIQLGVDAVKTGYEYPARVMKQMGTPATFIAEATGVSWLS